MNARRARPDPADGHPLADLDRVIHEHTRLLIVSSLWALEEADYTFLVNLTGLTWGNISSHLARLEDAGYVEVEKQIQGRRVVSVIRLTRDGRQAFRAYRRRMLAALEDLPD